ncbi:MAG TPA: replication-associated recombination protein A [Polyangiaceae bacterium]|nr:replication-associated recombination protein A [Polyangiaceae bacterium]
MAKSKNRAPTNPDETLFSAAARQDSGLGRGAPLAERMRPRSLDELVGQAHLVGQGKLLGRAIAEDRIPSMILWGPPGSGKTTIARIVAEASGQEHGRTPSRFVPFSAVLGGIPELRTILEEAKQARAYQGARTILFIDEIHRFNKAQQDAFLPHVEHGAITLIGATTENPSFAVNAALLSRCRVFRLEALTNGHVETVLRRALSDPERGLGHENLTADDEVIEALARAARGDARRALTALEMTASHVRAAARTHVVMADLAAASEDATLLYDKKGEEHYNVTSAFIKAMRGSDPDAAIYYMMRMVEAGDDPLFVLRRMLIFASEDIGNADPRALMVAVAADDAFRRMGMPEGMYPMAHACLYLACAPKSDGVKRAWHSAALLVKERGALPVPKKLRNAVTGLMKSEGYGEGYRYAHEFEGHVVPGETYLPEEIADLRFYEPSEEGLEKAIKERLQRIRSSQG